jgi:retinol dehydrogenase-14
MHLPNKQSTIFITGATSGIGKATAKLLIDKGRRVIIHGRDKKSVQDTCSEFNVNGLAVPVWGDFFELKQVHSFAKQVSKITPVLDCFILNAGVFQSGGQRSVDGFELDFAVNYLSHF